MSDFGSMLKRARKERGISQRQLASAVGCSHTHLAHIEAGRAIPSPKLISAAADFYGADVFELCVAAGQLPPELTNALKELPASALRRVYYDVMGKLEKTDG